MQQNYNKNNKSLALLGQGRWKQALKFTLLLIGFVMGFGMMGAYAQTLTPIPEGLKMEKKWVPTNDMGSQGNILVETFVTGHSVAQHMPTDIVLVLDVSGSMNDNISTDYVYTARPSQAYSYNGYGNNTFYVLYNGQYYQVARERSGGIGNRRYNLHFNVGNTTYYLYGTGVQTTNPNVQGGGTTIWTGVLYERTTQNHTKLDALKDAVNQFVDIIAEDAEEYEVDHSISIIKYAGSRYYPSNNNSDDPINAANASNIDEGNHRYASGNYQYNYTEVLVKPRNPNGTDNDLPTGYANNKAYIQAQVNALQQGGATAADFGMNKARYVLASIPEPAEGQPQRSKVVVMFTDGEPNHNSGFNNDVANSVISFANSMKHSWTNGGNTYDFNATVFTIGVFGANVASQTHTYMDYASSNYPDAQSMTNGGTQASSNYYLTAESASGLSDIFVAIAGASGAMSLPSATIVQDMVSPNFQMPEGATGTVIAYAPLCTNYNEATGEYTFEELNDAGTLTVDANGVVTGGSENKLPANFVTVNGKTIQMSGFDFSEHWCGWQEDDHGNKTIHGRKIVIKIPVEVQPGMWGDGIDTNDPEHSYVQVGDVYYGPFNCPSADVLGNVWTEIVTTEPTGFDPMNIDSPEDLAWFISCVNGRINYNSNNTVASDPGLDGRLTADIDMSAHNWVSIGAGYKCNNNNQYVDASGAVVYDPTVKLAYEGNFDGNGHVITGLKNNADKWYELGYGQDNAVLVYPGMFSNVKGTVHDVFILDSDFRAKAHQIEGQGTFLHHGILADTLTGGTIYNCEAAGRITCNDEFANNANLVFGGLVGLNNGGTIYNAMAMANLTGFTMGGAVGENRSNGSFKNGFTNGEYHYIGGSGANRKNVGGLAASNAGTIDNCYVRFERYNENLNKATFNQLVASGTEATNCYTQQLVTWSRPSSQSITTETNTNPTVPNTILNPADNDENSYTISVNKTFYNMFTNDNMTGGEWGTLGSFNVYENGTPLLDKLNEKKGDDGATWKRTTAGKYSVNAGDINDDFPVLQLPGYTCLASTDGITIDYAHNLSDMLHRHNSGALNENTALADSYKVTDHAAINGGSINLFANEDMNPSNSNSGAKADLDASYYNTDANVVVYIDENISLLQPTDATTTPSSIEAYTGQTLKAFDNTELQEGDRWHNISSSLSNSMFGWDYSNNEQVEHNWESDPCGWNLYNHDEDYAFFPIDLSSYHRAEFYCFYEPQYHWLNFRRNKLSHWHMDNYELNISYDEQEDHFIPGKGYLAAVDMSTYWSDYNREDQFLQNRGKLNNGPVEIEVTADGPEWTGLKGYNLLGNPYQSYLDFTTFAWENSTLWSDPSEMTFAIYDPESSKYVQGVAGAQPSEGSLATTGDINMHQGFLIRVSTGGTATFNNDMRHNEPAAGTHFRGERLNYPVINLIATDRQGNTDVAVLEVGRPENAGGQKLRVGSATGRISLRHDNTDFGILFRDMNEGNQPLYFNAEEDGTFTLNWNTANANFSSLTLVDNITGVRTDMLARDSYAFEGRTSDYKSRFKILIGEFTDIEENEETVTNNFAFFDGSEWVVNGQGQLTVTDVMGRTVYNGNLANEQNRVNLNNVAPGVYLMQVLNANGAMVQKIVVR